MRHFDRSHRSFLQTMMSRGIITAVDAKSIVGKVTEEGQVSDEDLSEFVRVVNNGLASNHLEMELRFGFGEASSELEGGQMLVLVNRSKGQQGQENNGNSPFDSNETEFLKMLIREMVGNEGGYLTKLRCLDLATESNPGGSQATPSQAPRLKIAGAERFLDRLLRMGWIVQDKNGLTLGCRAVLELEPMLREVYNIPECGFCRGLVLIAKDQHCARCDQRFHTRCLRQRPAPATCPNAECDAIL